jgi:hypothetical protein
MSVVIAITSDQHARSTVGLCSPKGVALDDGGRYKPSRAQEWLWQAWVDGWDRVGECAHKHNAPIWWINNGDLVDGDHHNTYQIVSRNSIQEREIVRDILDIPLLLQPEHIFFVRGTETHVGQGACSEESIARALSDDWPVAWAHDPHTASWWYLPLECEGVLLDILHHGRTGLRPWTQYNASALLAAQIVMERVSNRERIPDLAIRSHYHRYSDSYEAQRCRVIQTPAFQLATAYVHRRVPESLADIGMVWLVIDGDQYEVHKHIQRPSRGEAWRVSEARDR